MKNVIILKGLPASGKSTFARKIIDENPGMYKRVNKDELRLMLDNSRWSKDNEKYVLYLRDQIILSALESGKHVIVDDTNLHPKHEINIRNLVKGKATVEVYDDFETDPLVCIKRDLKRPNSVGQKVIMDMYKQFFEPNTKKYEPDPNLPEAVIFDIDGTLAIKGNRSPYDWAKVGMDLPNYPVIELLWYMQNKYKIIIMSGRDSVCRAETDQWLCDNKIEWHELYMREKDDSRKDSIVKKELFQEASKKYAIQLVVDDRNQVVEMWRSMGLTCFQVAEGDF